MNMLNDGNHMSRIITDTACGKHDAPRGVACFAITADHANVSGDRTLLAICNKRAVKGGANGEISESSYQASKRTKSKPRPKA